MASCVNYERGSPLASGGVAEGRIAGPETHDGSPSTVAPLLRTLEHRAAALSRAFRNGSGGVGRDACVHSRPMPGGAHTRPRRNAPILAACAVSASTPA